jgi:hypothetical protein
MPRGKVLPPISRCPTNDLACPEQEPSHEQKSQPTSDARGFNLSKISTRGMPLGAKPIPIGWVRCELPEQRVFTAIFYFLLAASLPCNSPIGRRMGKGFPASSRPHGNRLSPLIAARPA